LMTIVFAACSNPQDPFPRPKGWPRIDLPQHAYQKFENNACPFTFEYPQIGVIERQKEDSCWMDLYFKEFECRWHVTYRYVPGSGKSVNDHFEEYRKLVFKHIQKVSQIEETPLAGTQGNGVLYELFGTVGVPAQMLYTDSLHLVMASFYFDTAVRNDSLAPVIDFMKEDMRHMAESIVWKQ
jgi:gliding motility-associated lipoprotein GldD